MLCVASCVQEVKDGVDALAVFLSLDLVVTLALSSLSPPRHRSGRCVQAPGDDARP